MLQNKHLNIGFIGRLEKEKGIEYICEIIEGTKDILPITYHIIGDGTYKKYFQYLSQEEKNVIFYGPLKKEEVMKKLVGFDALLMPSIFLETFGLVALEGLLRNIPVIGPRDGGLADLISEDYSIRKNYSREDTIAILKKLATGWKGQLIDSSGFTYDTWVHNLQNILGGSKNILIIHDNYHQEGGAEKYIHFLERTIKHLKYSCHIIFSRKVSQYMKILEFFITPFAFWRFFQVKNALMTLQPDVIWLQSIHRTIGIWGLLAVKQSGIKTIMTHHDFGLICARPSNITHIGELPTGPNLREFLKNSHNLMEYLFRIYKYFLLLPIYSILKKIDIHLVPSTFMKSCYEPFIGQNIRIFPHTDITRELPKSSQKPSK